VASRNNRRQEILDAALAAFSERGFATATIDDVRKGSGASIGSIYHHFGGKEDLADALYFEALRDYQAGIHETLRRNRDARRGVQGLVRHHLRWVATHPDLARWLIGWRGGGEAVKELNRDLIRAMNDWLRPHVDAGRVRELPLDLTYVILIGPAQEFARQWLEGRLRASMKDAERTLPAAAWSALDATRGD